MKMDTLNKLIQQIYHVPDSRIPALAEKFFSHLLKIWPECSVIPTLHLPIPSDLKIWNEIHERIEAIKDLLLRKGEINSRQDSRLDQIVNEFEKEAIKRIKRLEYVGTFLEKEAIPFYLKLTHLNPNNFGTRIKQFWNKIDTPENQKYCIKKSPFNLKSGKITQHIIEQELKLLSLNIHLIIEGGEIEKGRNLLNEFAGIRTAIRQYYSYKNEKNIEGKKGDIFTNSPGLNDFDTCSLCWRLVPKKAKGDSKKPYCKIHTYDPASPVPQTEYNIALKLNHKSNYENSPEPLPPLPGTATQIHKLLRTYFPMKDGDISRQDWVDAISGKVSRLDLNFFPKVEYDLERLWIACPNVHRFIIENGGDDKTPEGILKELDPETLNESDEFKYERDCLHKLFSKNFGLYRLELALAESYLSEYYQYMATHPHGGKRPGTGGRRKGAGRKPKSR